MTGLYVASNPQTIISQNQLNRNVAELSDVLTRLSTGLRINSGKDDPAGLIASELLKSDITATNKAISNAQRANSVIAIADSALGQVSNLLNDIKGLIVEAANSGAMTKEQIEANQLQVDASLDSIDRISKSINYQGKMLLDGSQSFQTMGVDDAAVSDLTIHQANFGTSDKIEVNVEVEENAGRARLTYDRGGISEALVLEVGGNQGTDVFSFAAGTSVTKIAEAVNRVSDSTGVRAVVGQDETYGQLLATSAGENNDINFTALLAGYAGGNYTIKYVAGNTSETTYTITEPSGDEPGVIEFQLKMEAWGNANAEKLDESYNGIQTRMLGIAGNTVAENMIVQSDSDLVVNSFSVVRTTGAGGAGGANPSVDFDAKTGHLQILANEGTTNQEIADLINGIKGLSVVQVGTGAGANSLAGNTAAPRPRALTTDVRANNALNVTAKTAGTKYDNTDVVFLQGSGPTVAAAASVEITAAAVGAAAGADTVTFTAAAAGASMNGYTFDFASNGAGESAVTINGKGITINSDASAADVTAALAAIGITATFNGAATPATFAADHNLVDGGNAVAGSLTMTGGTDDYPGYSFHYTDSGSKSGVTVSASGDASGSQFMRLSSKTGGAEYNEVGVEFVATNGPLSVVYDEVSKVLRIYGGTAGGNQASLGDLMAAIEKNSPFKAEFFSDLGLNGSADLGQNMAFSGASTMYTAATGTFDADIKTGQSAADLGTDHQALIITVDPGITANQVVEAFKNDPLSHLFNITNANDSDGSGTIFWSSAEAIYTESASFVYSGALKGGTAGYETAVTAAELVEFVNNDEVLSKIIRADLGLNTPTGTGKLTLFEEYAYYGDPNAGTGLQFLGPKDSTDIIFASNLKANGSKIPNQELAMWFTPDVEGYSRIDIPAKNANAAISVTAKNKGEAYDDMVVRYVRLGNDQTESYVTYEEGPSNAMAYCSINDGGTTGSHTETGKFIVYANDKGELYNNVEIVAKLDKGQGEAAKATFDKDTGKLIVTVNSTSVTLSQALAAINDEGTFSADYDFSYNHDTGDTGPANTTFASLLSDATTTKTIGNTGQTGGHSGGVMTVYLAGDDDSPNLSAQAVVDLINGDPRVSELFSASNYGSSDGTGLISFRDDNLKTVTGGCGEQLLVPTSTSSGGIAQKGQMVIQLATDKYGNYTTTAKELVEFFDQLTAEQTRGVSVSVVRPPGVDNLNRTWVDDGCGNITEERACDDDYGNGVLKPVFELDECDQLVYEVISFTSFGSNIQPSHSNDDLVSVNGWESMFNVSAKKTGAEYDGISLVYERITDVNEAPSAAYDEAKKQIVIRIHDGVTTASQVKAAIEADAITNSLFSITLKKDGGAAVTITDDSLDTKYGTYEAGYRGGARMLGGADADPHSLTFESVEEGSGQTITVKSKNGTEFNLKNEDGKVADKATGTDMVARINGISATANGRKLSIDTTGLKLTIDMSDKVESGDSINFDITGGGMMFQIGPDVVSNQQIRLGLMSVNTASLGGVSGRLYQLRSGNNADLITSDETRKLADLIVNDAITAVATMRGRLGALQKCTFEPTIASLQDSLESLTSAEASISNADFAEESSKLTRAQILVQSGTRTLSLANQLPQYAASLIGG